MTRHLLSALILASFPAHADDLTHQTLPNDNPEMTLSHFAFGSCWKSTHSQKHWKPIVENKPQLWLWLGDNIYGDTDDMTILRKKYGELAAKEGYRELAKSCPVLATWDDHDYGKNDAGNDYAKRAESQKVFLEFFNERADSVRHKREGVYTSYCFGPAEKRVQLLVLDTRYFRSPLARIDGKPPYRPMGNWAPDSSKEKTMLGEAQWKWLEEELKKPARLRLIGTSIQFAAPHNGFEAWNNFPSEQQRLVDLIKKNKAEGVFLLSGDIHGAELNMLEPDDCYPLIDFTSSSLNLPLGAARTRRRIGPGYGGTNFGTVDIDWDAADPVVSLSIKDTRNQTRLLHSIPLSNLTFDPKNTQSKATKYIGEWQTALGALTITQLADGKLTGTCADRKLALTKNADGLTGTWQGEKRSGKVTFKLTRDGRFLRGAYSYENLPLQLDWAGWKADWEKHFKRDDYKAKKK